MAEPSAGQTREGLALLFFNAIVVQEHPDGKYSRAYALYLLADVMATIDGKRDVPAGQPDAGPAPDLATELAAEGALAGTPTATAAPGSKSKAKPAEPSPEPKKRGRLAKVVPELIAPMRRGGPRRK